ncbi:hypothetical protein ACFYP6_29805 [Streptomyces goshikiensis]|uniref:hypothetical protein n=1 Tax=Streptomyces goshikiensis TaxID=1942 RepID=UPI0036BCA4DF
MSGEQQRAYILAPWQLTSLRDSHSPQEVHADQAALAEVSGASRWSMALPSRVKSLMCLSLLLFGGSLQSSGPLQLSGERQRAYILGPWQLTSLRDSHSPQEVHADQAALAEV